MASGRLADYIGRGVIADRPATPTLHAEAFGMYYATDTDELSIWDGTAWRENALAAPGTLTNAVDDAAAATAGVAVGEVYRNGSVVMIRVV